MRLEIEIDITPCALCPWMGGATYRTASQTRVGCMPSRKVAETVTSTEKGHCEKLWTVPVTSINRSITWHRSWLDRYSWDLFDYEKTMIGNDCIISFYLTLFTYNIYIITIILYNFILIHEYYFTCNMYIFTLTKNTSHPKSSQVHNYEYKWLTTTKKKKSDVLHT